MGCVFMSSRRRKANENQISIYDMVLRAGDKLFKDGALYGEVAGESDSLYFVVKTNSKDNMPIPFQKNSLLNNILMGILTMESYSFDKEETGN
jgi:preprotein translocase subunit YajC